MSIEVHVRIRPSVGNIVWSSAETVLYSTANPNTRYVYNKVHPSNSTNESIFHGIEAIVHAAFDGKNVTVMAYGQTGSGKTHSMIGVHEDPGMVPRAARLLLELKRHTPGTTIQAFYTEIYNESVKDLLEPQRGELALHDATDGGVYFDKKMIDVQSFDDFIQLQKMAERNRKYGVTNLNEHSSRSHVILTFEIHRHNRAGKSVINLVDLAGSESAARANTEGLSLREGGFINRSLLTLGNVVDAIVERRPYIPYRDAKLTRILRACLGGSGITLILCCVNPARENFDQTVATLRFTQRAMKIKNDPVVVLNMPPLFAHQYSDGARQLIEGLKDAAEAEYQRGLRDSYLYCGSTVASVVTNFQTQVSDCLHSLANGQRLLVAHDHAMAIDHIGRLYNQLNDLTRQRLRNQELAENERKRQRDIASEVETRKEKVTKYEEELNTKVSSVDTEMAGWEYQLYEARHKQRSEAEVLVQSELARRARIQYEWALCLERIASRCVPLIQRGLHAMREKLVQSAKEDGDVRDPATVLLLSQDVEPGYQGVRLKELRVALIKARDEVADLETAHEMVREDIDEAKRQQQQQHPRASASVSPQPRPNVSEMTEEELLTHYRGVPDGEVEERIHRLEREERALMAQARRGVRRESLRRVRESLRVSRGSHGGTASNNPSRSPQTGGVTITRRPDVERGPTTSSNNVPAAAAAPHRQKAANMADVDKSPSAESSSPIEARVVGGRRSSVNYADGVRNALSILDSLKAQLQRKTAGGASHVSPIAASTSRSQHAQRQRQDSASTNRPRSISSSDGRRRGGGGAAPKASMDETTVYRDPETREGDERTGTSADAANRNHNTARNVANSSERRRGARHGETSRTRSSPPPKSIGAAGQRRTATDTENMTLAELYQAAAAKENWGHRTKATASAGVSRGAFKYTTVEEDNVAFDVDREGEEEVLVGEEVDDAIVDHPNDDPNVRLRSSPPVGIAARRKLERQHSRPAVERALYSLNSNSHSPSTSLERRSRSRKA